MSSAIVRNVVCSVISWSPTHHVTNDALMLRVEIIITTMRGQFRPRNTSTAEREVEEEHDADQDGHEEVDRLRRRRERRRP